jgi:hypothetical protein
LAIVYNPFSLAGSGRRIIAYQAGAYAAITILYTIVWGSKLARTGYRRVGATVNIEWRRGGEG